MFMHRRAIATRLLVRAKSTLSQSTMQQRVIERFNARDMAVVFIKILVVGAIASFHSGRWIALDLHSIPNRCSLIPPERRLHYDIPPFWLNYSPTQSFYSAPAMPRIRGKSRRGATSHSEEARRKRQQKFEAAEARRIRKQIFERAMTLVARRRRTKPRTPPMAYVEEVIPEDGLPSPPRCILFTTPEHWNPSISLGTYSTCQLDHKEPDPCTATLEQQYSPCYVTEEAPPEPTSEKEGAGREAGHGTQNPDENISQEPPREADWRYLDLILEIRHQLNDQTFRLERLDQRMDMFFGAHSRASAKKQCPTCARPYSFPARWRHTGVQD
jgi:hypothetical protein